MEDILQIIFSSYLIQQLKWGHWDISTLYITIAFWSSSIVPLWASVQSRILLFNSEYIYVEYNISGQFITNPWPRSIYNSKKSCWLSPLKSPAKKRLPMTIGDLEVWNSLGSLGEVKAHTHKNCTFMVPVEDGTVTLECPHPEIKPRWGNKPWLCFPKSWYSTPNAKLRVSVVKHWGQGCFFSNFPFRKENLHHFYLFGSPDFRDQTRQG